MIILKSAEDIELSRDQSVKMLDYDFLIEDKKKILQLWKEGFTKYVNGINKNGTFKSKFLAFSSSSFKELIRT